MQGSLYLALPRTEPVFSTNWSRGRSYWGELFSATGLTGKPGLRFLEIGGFEGRATLWLLENVLTDAVLAWPLLKRRGLLAFDDYTWQLAGSEHERPAIGIDASRAAFGSQLALLYEGAQLAVARL